MVLGAAIALRVYRAGRDARVVATLRRRAHRSSGWAVSIFSDRATFADIAMTKPKKYAVPFHSLLEHGRSARLGGAALLAGLLLAGGSSARAEVIGGVEFPLGNLSFADSVVNYD